MNNFWNRLPKPIFALAPMAGYTDAAFRLLCLEYGADTVYTEMVSVEALWRKNEKTLKMLNLLPGEKKVILQLFGSQPKSFKKALELLNVNNLRQGQIKGIDINLGCPAHKVIKTGSGAALMDNKKLARQIIQIALDNTSLPISIKIRSQVKQTSAVEFIEFIKDLPVSAVMVHGRSLKQSFSGPIDFETIKKVKQLLPTVPVLANGGINSLEDAAVTLAATGADGLGIGHGAWGRPWFFTLLRQARNSTFFKTNRKNLDDKIKKTTPQSLNYPETKKTMLRHAQLYLKYSGNLIPLRKHLVHYVKKLPNAAELRQKIIKIKTLEELENI